MKKFISILIIAILVTTSIPAAYSDSVNSDSLRPIATSIAIEDNKPILTKEIVIQYCREGKRILWRKYKLTPVLARWILKIAAENCSPKKKSEDVVTSDFENPIAELNGRRIFTILFHPQLQQKGNKSKARSLGLVNLKLLAGYDTNRRVITKNMVINFCKNGKEIPWQRYSLDQEFARWILEIVGKNCMPAKRAKNVLGGDIDIPIRALNNRRISGLLKHPQLYESGKPVSNRKAVLNLKKLAGLEAEGEKVELTKDIVARYCKANQSIHWSIYRLTPEFAKWILKVVAENCTPKKEPEYVIADDFCIAAKNLFGKKVYPLLFHPQLHRRGKPESMAMGVVSLKKLAGYKIRKAKKELTLQLVRQLCKYKRNIKWTNYKITPQFARWVLRIVAQNCIPIKKPKEVSVSDFRKIAALNNKDIVELLCHPRLQDKGSPVSAKTGLVNLKKLAGCKVKKRALTPFTVRRFCKYNLDVPWADYNITSGFARWILKIVAKSCKQKKDPKDVNCLDFHRQIKSLNNRAVAAILSHPQLQKEEKGPREYSALTELKRLAYGSPKTKQQALTEKIFVKFCKSSGYFSWFRYEITPKFARFILEVAAENCPQHRTARETIINDFLPPIKKVKGQKINPRYIACLLLHQQLQRPDQPSSYSIGLMALKKLAYGKSIEEPKVLTEEIFIKLCKKGRPVLWRKYEIVPEFARFVIEVVAENCSPKKKPEQVFAHDFVRFFIKYIRGRRIKSARNINQLLLHPQLQEGAAHPTGKIGFNNLREIARYKIKEKHKPVYSAPVDRIMSSNITLNDVKDSQIKKLVLEIQKGNIAAEERLSALFRPVYEKNSKYLKYRIKERDDREDLSQVLEIAYMIAIRNLTVNIAAKEQIILNIKRTLRREYGAFCRKDRRERFALSLNAPVVKGKKGSAESREGGLEFLELLTSSGLSSRKESGLREVLTKLIEIMRSKHIKTRDISLFFDFYLSGFSKREIGFKYNLSDTRAGQIAMGISASISTREEYRVFAREVKSGSYRQKIDYTKIIETDPAIRQFRRTLCLLPFEREGAVTAPVLIEDIKISAAFYNAA